MSDFRRGRLASASRKGYVASPLNAPLPMTILHHARCRQAGLIALLFLVMTVALSAQAPSRLAVGPRDTTELEAFLDGQIQTLLKAKQIAGGTVAVVKDGALFLSKGYGFADLDSRRPVDPAQTLFRIGSISKTFLWTAVMQLEQEGLVDLDADVNRYLTAAKVPDAFGQPVTLRQLMTHTPGFEDRVIGLFAEDSSAVRPLADILTEQMPARVRPPGVVSTYSNHGSGIAGLVVESVTGLGWDAYVERHILEPLGMGWTSFRQPLPAHLKPHLSEGYRVAGGRFEKRDFEFVPLAPAGSASSTADDMARYMLMHLQRGTYDGAQIIDSTTAVRMHARIFAHDDAVDGMAHGFYEMNRNGHRVIGHGGATFWFHSDMALLPDDGVGIFLSFNTESAGGVARDVVDAFLDRYFPSDSTGAPARVFATPGQLDRFAGVYRSSRYPHQRLTKLMALFGAFDVVVTEDSLLELRRFAPQRYMPVGPLTFQAEHGQERLVFKEDKDGAIAYLFLSDSPVNAFEKVPLSGRPSLHLGIFLFGLFMIVSTLLVWPAAALVRRRHHVREEPRRRLPRVAVWAGWFASFFLVAFLVGIALALSDQYEIVYGVPQTVKILLILPLLAAVLSLVALVLAVIMIDHGTSTLWRRIWFVLLLLGLIGLLWQLFYWNLLGFWY